MPPGRPTKYQEHYPEKAWDLCAEFGFTDKKLARVFDVDVATIQRWKKSHPEFSDSIRAGKDEYDSDAIEKSLRRRALGFRFSETTKELSALPDPETGKAKMITTKKVRKFIPPDTKAIEFWLRNRRNKRWPNKQELNIGGELGLNVNAMTEERKKELKELAHLRSTLELQKRRDGQATAGYGLTPLIVDSHSAG